MIEIVPHILKLVSCSSWRTKWFETDCMCVLMRCTAQNKGNTGILIIHTSIAFHVRIVCLIWSYGFILDLFMQDKFVRSQLYVYPTRKQYSM